VFCPVGNWSVRFDGTTFSDSKINDNEPGENSRFLVIAMMAKNVSMRQNNIAWSTFTPKLTDKDGNSLEWNSDTLQGSRDQTINSQVDPGQEIKFRHYFSVPNDVSLKDYSIKEADGRAYVFDLSGVK
jgi:hypothetical protein